MNDLEIKICNILAKNDHYLKQVKEIMKVIKNYFREVNIK